MRNVVSPRGPLSPKVYWRRRLLMLAVVVGVVLLVGQLFGGGADTAPVAERADPEATAQPRQPAPTATAGAEPRSRDAATRRSTERGRSARGDRKAGRREREPAQSPALRGAAGPLATPAGPCKASEVVIVPDVEDTDAFGVVPLRLGVSTSGGQACTFEFGPDTVAVQITSGDDLIWQSLHCGRVLEEQSVVARPGWLSYITVQWPGRRGEESCGDGNEFAQPGYYWAEAAAIGGEPERSQFELETPPKPTKEPTKEPTAEPSKQGTTEPGEQSGPDRQGEQREQGTQDEGTQDARDDGGSATDDENQTETKPTATATGDAESGQT